MYCEKCGKIQPATLQGVLEVFAFWGESGTFLLRIIICIKRGTLLGNICFFWWWWGGGGIF